MIRGMRYPDAGELEHLVETPELPPMARVRYEPPATRLDDVIDPTETALETLVGDLPAGAEIVFGLGSRGITDIAPIATAAVDWCRDRGLAPRVVPAMGSHGGGTPAGQRAVLADLGLDEESLGCPVDASMETITLGAGTVDGHSVDVHFAASVRPADAIVPINRVAPHTSFAGRVESGICKMLAVGFGKQAGARVVHRYGRSFGFVPTLEAMLPVIRSAVAVPGGIAIVENHAHETSEVVPIAGDDLIEAEAAVLGRAREQVNALPFDTIDLLIVDEIGKNIAGTGMDPNVIGRGKADPTGRTPEIERIYARALTEETGGNANGVGFADAIHRDLAEAIDVQSTYANVLTSGYPGKAALPMVLPSDELAVSALVDSLGAVPAGQLRVVWIEHTAALSPMHVSTPLLQETDTTDLAVDRIAPLRFSDGRLIRTREDS